MIKVILKEQIGRWVRCEAQTAEPFDIWIRRRRVARNERSHRNGHRATKNYNRDWRRGRRTTPVEAVVPVGSSFVMRQVADEEPVEVPPTVEGGM